jgi:hypothetical protein
MSTFAIKQGDYHRRLALDLTDISTTGASSVAMTMRPRDGGAAVTIAGVIDSATRVSCQFVAPQLATPGVYDLETTLTYADGTETAPTSGYTTVIVGARLA